MNRVVLLLLAALLLRNWEPVSAISPDKVVVTTDQTGARLEIPCRQPSRVRSQVEDRELLLQFDEALQLSNVAELSGLAPSWIAWAAAGYDSLLIVGMRAVQYSVEADKQSLVIRLSPLTQTTGPPRSGTEDAGPTDPRLQLLAARLMLETGKQDEAIRLLERVRSDHPDNHWISTTLAEAQWNAGRWRAAEAIYLAMLTRDSGNEDIEALGKTLRRSQASHIGLEMDSRSIQGGESVRVLRLRGETRISDSLRFGFVTDRNSVEVDELRLLNGEITSFSGVRYRAELFLQQSYLNGSQLKGSFFVAGAGPGFGLQYLTPGGGGRSGVELIFRQPFWDFVESAAGRGVRDRVGLTRSQDFHRRVTGWANVGMNRYGLEDLSNAAQSVSAQGGVSYALKFGRPELALHYSYDGEYRTWLQSRVSPRGSIFYPLPLVSREVHSGTFSFGYGWTPFLHTQGYAGYLKDRLGGRGPTFGVRVNCQLMADMEAQFWFDQSAYAIDTARTYRSFGFYVFRRMQ